LNKGHAAQTIQEICVQTGGYSIYSLNREQSFIGGVIAHPIICTVDGRSHPVAPLINDRHSSDADAARVDISIYVLSSSCVGDAGQLYPWRHLHSIYQDPYKAGPNV